MLLCEIAPIRVGLEMAKVRSSLAKSGNEDRSSPQTVPSTQLVTGPKGRPGLGIDRDVGEPA